MMSYIESFKQAFIFPRPLKTSFYCSLVSFLSTLLIHLNSEPFNNTYFIFKFKIQQMFWTTILTIPYSLYLLTTTYNTKNKSTNKSHPSPKMILFPYLHSSHSFIINNLNIIGAFISNSFQKKKTLPIIIVKIGNWKINLEKWELDKKK
jgi:hypothetical protein